MKKIGIITIHNSPNYGASLQSFALWKYLQNEGYDCEIIDLARPHENDFVASEKYKCLISNKKPFSQRLKINIKKIINTIFKKTPETPFNKELIQRDVKFNAFNAQVRLSKRYRSVDELYENPPMYNVYITGSDQVWNPELCNMSMEPYFLSFVNNGGKKISYAPSVGVTSLTDGVKTKYEQWLASYSHISVREEEGKILLQPIAPNDIKVVLDPTFLLDIADYQSIAKKPVTDKKYIFCFTLGEMPALRNYAEEIANELGLELIVMNQYLQKSFSGGYQYIVDAGIEEFLGWIESAEIVFSNSFHATVFSIMLSKNFFAYISEENKRGSRIINLLSNFNLSEHLLNNSFVQSSDELMSCQIDRLILNHKIVEKQEKSRKFLLAAIED